MAFDIHQKLFTEDGELLEKEARAYQDELLELFARSPEAQALRDEGVEGGWVGLILDFAASYIGAAPPQMSADDMRRILFDLIPRKLSASADDAPDIVRELRAFWTFLQREFHLKNAVVCLDVLNDQAIHQLQQGMDNPANFGIAKSFMMMGMPRGFDLTSEEGLNEWTATYNAEIAAGAGPRIPLPGERDENAQQFHTALKFGTGKTRSAKSSTATARAKMAKASRKQNRKKK